MRKKWVIIVLMVAMSAMLAGAGSGFAATYYFASVLNGGADLNLNNVANYFTLSAGGGAPASPLAEGDVLVFDTGSSAGALSLVTSGALAFGVTLKIVDPGGLVTVTAGHNIKLSGIDMSTATQALTIFAGAGTITLSTAANFITLTGQALTFASPLANGGFLLTVSGDGTPTFSGGMTGTGGLTLNMTANQAVTFTGTEATYTGNTTITSGFLTTGAAEKFTNFGTYSLANSANARLVTGGVETIGSLSGGGGAGGNVVMGGALTVNQTTTTTYSGIISSNGVFDKIGAGTLKLAGANTYIGATHVTNGTLLVNGVQAGTGAYTVYIGATLGGTGTVNDAVTINNGGFVNPGDPAVGSGIGTLTTTGTFTFASGSRLYVDILNGTTDLLAPGGVTTITAGAEISLGAVTGALAQLYTVINASAGVALFTVNNTGWAQTNPGTTIKLFGVAGVSTPTLNQWGLILFALFIAGFAVWSIRRKSYTAA